MRAQRLQGRRPGRETLGCTEQAGKLWGHFEPSLKLTSRRMQAAVAGPEEEEEGRPGPGDLRQPRGRGATSPRPFPSPSAQGSAA